MLSTRWICPIEYVSGVWDRCSEQDSQTLQKIENEAAHLVTGLIREHVQRMWMDNSITKKAEINLLNNYICVNS